MAIKIPDSMEQLIYWTSRKVGSGYVKAWAYKEDCPECGKAKMGKPVGKNGKVKIRAKYYVCSECGHEVEKVEYEETLTAQVMYTCPHCSHKGEAEIPFIRRTYKKVKSLVFECSKCKEKIPITKKMKAIK